MYHKSLIKNLYFGLGSDQDGRVQGPWMYPWTCQNYSCLQSKYLWKQPEE